MKNKEGIVDGRLLLVFVLFGLYILGFGIFSHFAASAEYTWKVIEKEEIYFLNDNVQNSGQTDDYFHYSVKLEDGSFEQRKLHSSEYLIYNTEEKPFLEKVEMEYKSKIFQIFGFKLKKYNIYVPLTS